MAPSKPRDRREYIRLTVNLPSNPKLMALDDPAAGWLYVAGICHAGEHLTDGVLMPNLVARLAGVSAEIGERLVAAGLWHAPDHGCPVCPQPGPGQVVIHDYLEHQRSREEAENAKRAGRAAADARWGNGPTDAKRNANRNAKGIATRNASGNAEAKAEVEAEGEVPLLLTYVGRLAVSDARDDASLPASVIAAWEEIAGPGVNIAREAGAYLAHHGDRPARNERSAWLGWLKRAREFAASQRGETVRPLGCDDCIGGWMPGSEDLPRRCPKCKPHAAPVADVVQIRANA